MGFINEEANKRKEEYIKEAIKAILSSRSDLSSKLIHLTRSYGKFTAEENLISILSSSKIEARNVDFYLKTLLPLQFHNDFKVLSLTETPLDQIKNITNIEFRRKVNLEPYGLIFSKNDLLTEGASPVNYLYHDTQRNFYREHFIEYISKDTLSDSMYIFPFLKTVSSLEDFHWEREWKKVGDLNFENIPFTIIVPSVESIKNIYKSVYLHQKKDINFFTLDSEKWGSITYMEDDPHSIPEGNVMLRTYAEINVWGEFIEEYNFPEVLFCDHIKIKDKVVNAKAYYISLFGEEI